jgi:hypothetical protein
MNETRFRPDEFREVGKEGNHVVLHFALDGVDAFGIEFGVSALVPDDPRSLLRNHPQLGHRIGGMCFDFEPDAVFGFRRPDCRHGLAGVAGDHRDLVIRFALMAYRGRPTRHI